MKCNSTRRDISTVKCIWKCLYVTRLRLSGHHKTHPVKWPGTQTGSCLICHIFIHNCGAVVCLWCYSKQPTFGQMATWPIPVMANQLHQRRTTTDEIQVEYSYWWKTAALCAVGSSRWSPLMSTSVAPTHERCGWRRQTNEPITQPTPCQLHSSFRHSWDQLTNQTQVGGSTLFLSSALGHHLKASWALTPCMGGHSLVNWIVSLGFGLQNMPFFCFLFHLCMF